MILIRFANAIFLTNAPDDDIWKILLEMKLKQDKLPYTMHCIVPRYGLYGLYDGPFMLNNVTNSFEKLLQVDPNDTIIENMSVRKLEQVSNMFLYLNMCSVILKPLFFFYKDLFYNKSPDQIVLALNRFSKGFNETNPENMFYKRVGKKLFTNITSLLLLKHEKITEMIKGSKEITFDKKVTGNQGIYLNIMFPIILSIQTLSTNTAVIQYILLTTTGCFHLLLSFHFAILVAICLQLE